MSSSLNEASGSTRKRRRRRRSEVAEDMDADKQVAEAMNFSVSWSKSGAALSARGGGGRGAGVSSSNGSSRAPLVGDISRTSTSFARTAAEGSNSSGPDFPQETPHQPPGLGSTTVQMSEGGASSREISFIKSDLSGESKTQSQQEERRRQREEQLFLEELKKKTTLENVESFLCEPQASHLLLKKSAITHRYTIPAVEEFYMVKSSPLEHRSDLTPMALLSGVAFIGLAILLYLDHWSGIVNIIGGSMALVVSVVNTVSLKCFRPASIEQDLRLVRLWECLVVVCILVFSLSSLEVYPHSKLCWDGEVERLTETVLVTNSSSSVSTISSSSSSLASSAGGGVAEEVIVITDPDAFNRAYAVCVRQISGFPLMGQAIPVFLLDMRLFLGAPSIAIYPLLHLFGRYMEDGRNTMRIDTPVESGVKQISQTLLTLLFLGALYGQSVERHRRFETWVLLQRTTTHVKLQRLKVDDILKNLLPPALLHKLDRGQAPLDQAENCTIVVTQIYDYVGWSTSVMPFQIVELIDALFSAFDGNVYDRFNLVKVKTVGDRYFACCGLLEDNTEEGMVMSASSKNSSQAGSPTTQKGVNNGSGGGGRGEDEPETPTWPVPDHIRNEKKDRKDAQGIRRTLRFAIWQHIVCKHLCNATEESLTLKTGIHFGAACGGILGSRSLWTDILGEACRVAQLLAVAAPESGITLTGEAVERANNFFSVDEELGQDKKANLKEEKEKPLFLFEKIGDVVDRGLGEDGVDMIVKALQHARADDLPLASATSAAGGGSDSVDSTPLRTHLIGGSQQNQINSEKSSESGDSSMQALPPLPPRSFAQYIYTGRSAQQQQQEQHPAGGVLVESSPSPTSRGEVQIPQPPPGMHPGFEYELPGEQVPAPTAILAVGGDAPAPQLVVEEDSGSGSANNSSRLAGSQSDHNIFLQSNGGAHENGGESSTAVVNTSMTLKQHAMGGSQPPRVLTIPPGAVPEPAAGERVTSSRKRSKRSKFLLSGTAGGSRHASSNLTEEELARQNKEAERRRHKLLRKRIIKAGMYENGRPETEQQHDPLGDPNNNAQQGVLDTASRAILRATNTISWGREGQFFGFDEAVHVQEELHRNSKRGEGSAAHGGKKKERNNNNKGRSSWCSNTLGLGFQDRALEWQFWRFQGAQNTNKLLFFLCGAYLALLLFTLIELGGDDSSSQIATILILITGFLLTAGWASVKMVLKSKKLNRLFRGKRTRKNIELVLLYILYLLPMVALAPSAPSVVNGSFFYLFIALSTLASFHLKRYSWWVKSILTSVLGLEAIVAGWWHQGEVSLQGAEVLAVLFFGGYLFYNGYSMESRRRILFQDAALSSAFNTAAENEYALLSGLLNMLMPKALIPFAIVKTTSQDSDGVVSSLGEVCVALLRIDPSAGNSLGNRGGGGGMVLGHSYHLEGIQALEYTERLYSAIEFCIERANFMLPGEPFSEEIVLYKVLEKISTIGDEVLIAGPVQEQVVKQTLEDANRAMNAVAAAPDKSEAKAEGSAGLSSKTKKIEGQVVEENSEDEFSDAENISSTENPSSPSKDGVSSSSVRWTSSSMRRSSRGSMSQRGGGGGMRFGGGDLSSVVVRSGGGPGGTSPTTTSPGAGGSSDKSPQFPPGFNSASVSLNPGVPGGGPLASNSMLIGENSLWMSGGGNRGGDVSLGMLQQDWLTEPSVRNELKKDRVLRGAVALVDFLNFLRQTLRQLGNDRRRSSTPSQQGGGGGRDEVSSGQGSSASGSYMVGGGRQQPGGGGPHHPPKRQQSHTENSSAASTSINVSPARESGGGGEAPSESSLFSAALHCGPGFASFIGRQRPAFTLLGPSVRGATALLAAAPSHTPIMSGAFHKLLSNGKVTLPRHELDYKTVSNTGHRWALRGIGLTQVYLLQPPALQSHSSMVVLGRGGLDSSEVSSSQGGNNSSAQQTPGHS